jgi:hypothetical protein
LSFAHHVHCFVVLDRSLRGRERAETEARTDSPFDRTVILLNGLITNDKFCFIRSSLLRLEWRRRRREVSAEMASLADYLQEERTLPGGDHEASLGCSPSKLSDSGCRAAVGSGLPTSPYMDGVERAGVRNTATASLSSKRRNKA